MAFITDVGARALVIGGVAAVMTAMLVGKEWLAKDYMFVLAIVAVVLIGGYRKTTYEHLLKRERLKRAHDLEAIRFIHGESVQLKLNTVTCILFFGTWCEKSREALEIFACLKNAVLSEKAQFVALTQESREELAMYEIKGRGVSNFRELKEFSFSIGIETGLMSKEYLVRCDLFTVPQVFIVGKNKCIDWYGDPCATIVERQIRSALDQKDVQIDPTG